MKIILRSITTGIIMSAILGSCGSKEDSDEAAVSTAATFTQVYDILETSCGLSGCHTGSTTPWSMQSTKDATYDEISEYINTDSPTSSKLITYGQNGANSHTGGKALKSSDAEKVTSWMKAGGENN